MCFFFCKSSISPRLIFIAKTIQISLGKTFILINFPFISDSPLCMNQKLNTATGIYGGLSYLTTECKVRMKGLFLRRGSGV